MSIYQQTKVAKKISAYNGNMYISNNKYHLKVLRNPKFKVKERFPYVGIVAPFTTTKLKSVCCCRREAGKMLTSAPVSMRKW